MMRDVGKAVVDLGRDRQGGRVEDENRFRNHQEGMVLMALEGA
jgi:hypothetical protein